MEPTPPTVNLASTTPYFAVLALSRLLPPHMVSDIRNLVLGDINQAPLLEPHAPHL